MEQEQNVLLTYTRKPKCSLEKIRRTNIIELPDGRCGAIEIKLGMNKAEEAAESLRKSLA